MFPHPGDLRIAELLETSLVSVKGMQSRGRLREPKCQVRMVPGELVEMLRCEARNLSCDELGSRNRVRSSLRFHLHASHGPPNHTAVEQRPHQETRT
jgi:hypothetical protein